MAEGVWRRLRVIEGSAGVRLETDPPIDVRLAAGESQAIPPGVPHAVSVDGPVSLVVDFLVPAPGSLPAHRRTSGPLAGVAEKASSSAERLGRHDLIVVLLTHRLRRQRNAPRRNRVGSLVSYRVGPEGARVPAINRG